MTAELDEHYWTALMADEPLEPDLGRGELSPPEPAPEPPPEDATLDEQREDLLRGSKSSFLPEPELATGLDVASPLDEVEAFLRRFVSYPSEDAAVAHTLWIAHTWSMSSWENTPRIGFLSPEPGSGKSRALEVTELLVPRPVHAVNVTPAYLFRKVSDEAGLPTILYDEVDCVFGPKAKDAEDVRGMLNAGTRRGATAGRCVIRGKIVETEELPAYCAVALAGLNDLPDTIQTRTIVIRMRRRAPNERVEPFRHRLHEPQGHEIRERLAGWIAPHSALLQQAWPELPEGIEDRNADCWEPLLAIADLAGGEWPERARCSAVALVADARGARGESLGIRLLTDCRTAFNEAAKDQNLTESELVAANDLPTENLLIRLNSYDESPWADLRGKPLDARALAQRLTKYGIKSRNVRIGDRVVKAYKREDFVDAWNRYLPPLAPGTAATSATPLQDPDGQSEQSEQTELQLATDISGDTTGRSQ